MYTYLSIMTGSEGVSFLLPQERCSRQRLQISSWVRRTRRKSGFLQVPSYGISYGSEGGGGEGRGGWGEVNGVYDSRLQPKQLQTEISATIFALTQACNVLRLQIAGRPQLHSLTGGWSDQQVSVTRTQSHKLMTTFSANVSLHSAGPSHTPHKRCSFDRLNSATTAHLNIG